MNTLWKAIVDLFGDAVPVISLVDEPAIDVDFEFFSSQAVFEGFKSVDSYQQKIAGPILIPDKRIYRIDKETGEPYDLYFDKKTVQGMADSFSRNQNNKNITIQHSGIRVPVTITEMWVTGKPDKSMSFGYDLPEGTWFCIAKVEDKDFFDTYVVTGKVKGFSIETKIKKEKIDMKENFESYQTKDGAQLEADKLEAGVAITVGGEPAADGSYELEDGTVVTVQAGVIEKVASPDTEQPADAQPEGKLAEEPVAPVDTPTEPKIDESAISDMVNKIVEQRMTVIDERIAMIEKAMQDAQSVADEAMSKINEFGAETPAAKPSLNRKFQDQLDSIRVMRDSKKA